MDCQAGRRGGWLVWFLYQGLWRRWFLRINQFTVNSLLFSLYSTVSEKMATIWQLIEQKLINLGVLRALLQSKFPQHAYLGPLLASGLRDASAASDRLVKGSEIQEPKEVVEDTRIGESSCLELQRHQFSFIFYLAVNSAELPLVVSNQTRLEDKKEVEITVTGKTDNPQQHAPFPLTDCHCQRN